MAKLAQTSVKYLVKASFTAEGLVEKPDVIGALFGQTEGLLGPDLDLRELQRTGRIGRVEVNSQFKEGKTSGEITLPSSLDSTETALVAAALETIERIGPCATKINVTSIEDLRASKRQYMMDRAKSLLSSMLQSVPESATVTEELMESVRSAEVLEFRGLPAGPDAPTADSLILVEGRADVVNLLRNGIKNVMAFGGTQIPPFIADISREREITAFLDGDRGGDLILKGLIEFGVEIDFVARAPEGKEVEELTKKELFKSLREKVPFEQLMAGKDISKISASSLRTFPKREARDSFGPGSDSGPREKGEKAERAGRSEAKGEAKAESKMSEIEREFFKSQAVELVGTRAAAIFDKNMKFSGRVPVKELATALKAVDSPSAVVLDGKIERSLIKLAETYGVKWLIGTAAEERSSRVAVVTSEEL